MKEKLLGMTLQELKQAAADCGLKPFVGAQLADWLYAKRATGWDRMVNISKAAREALAAKYDLGISAPAGSAVSTDGTKKYLFEVHPIKGDRPTDGEEAGTAEDREFIEAVMIPEEDRKTLCVSSQAGCRMGCKFCMTGRHGFHGQLDAADILNQFLSIDEAQGLTNAVFMGMGEPLDNYDAVSRAIDVITAPWGFAWSPKRVTVSTIGVLPVLKRFLDGQRCHLAVSLHNPFPEERLSLMPVQKAWDIREVIGLIGQYDFSGQRRVSFEYTMFAGFNDDKRHADALIRLLRGLECRVNLIRFHQIPDFPYTCASDAVMEAFRDRLNNHQILCTIRSSRGEDILAACGMLAGQHGSQ
ncbi:MAG: 23S rRNA (adenine(2503)-C(2))-methyltransferase RlmN [Bacteroidales bacterium]|jgi:23S rRNA (adenine2503-C2)-methyltransferase|nr:23S rRNA (adenine(2503)-C(2))-methyltransferase RlmN [Bacteroidales bacterium]